MYDSDERAAIEMEFEGFLRKDNEDVIAALKAY
jgi:hypothetical protein